MSGGDFCHQDVKGAEMKLYVASFSDNSYRVVIIAKDYNSALDKAKEYIKNNHSWYDLNRIDYDMRIDVCDEDYVIK